MPSYRLRTRRGIAIPERSYPGAHIKQRPDHWLLSLRPIRLKPLLESMTQALVGGFQVRFHKVEVYVPVGWKATVPSVMHEVTDGMENRRTRRRPIVSA
jgi:hypothetical protein